MKIYLSNLALIFAFNLSASAETLPAGSPPTGRGQWTTNEAWAWNEKVGAIRGFNQFGRAYPGMSEADVMRKARSLGYNSVRTGDYFRSWLKSPEETKRRMHELLDEAQTNGLTVSPVLIWGRGSIPGGRPALQDPNGKAWQDLRAFVHDFVGEFRNDNRIVLWDVFNEPANNDGLGNTNNADMDLRVASQLILWAREVNPSQPLTASAMWLGPQSDPARIALEQLSDVHNFHLYDCSTDQMRNLDAMIALLKNISDRPIVCTECLARPRGDTFGRILPAFSNYHVHWYNWGLYTSDQNWSVTWQRSTFDPHEPWFHDVLHPDGEPYDWRDLELIRNFHFAQPGETPDPGVEVTDRWTKDRAWQWFVSGPLRGRTYRPDGVATWNALWQLDHARMASMESELAKAQAAGCDGLRVRFDYAAWKADTNFCERVGDFLALADRHGMTVTPVLLTDADAQFPLPELTRYVSDVVKTFGRDGRIFCWELYYHPGGGLPVEQARALLRAAFQAARFEFPGQPLTATPAVRAEDFAPDFDYRKALAHQGSLGSHGWDKLQYPGTSDVSLCAYIWKLSDVLSIASDQKAPETGWLISMADRYGRPIICTEWTPIDPATVEATLKLFAEHHVRWFSTGSSLTCDDSDHDVSARSIGRTSRLQSHGLLDPTVLSADENLSDLVKQFQFQRVMTPRQ
jgi:hypothetical protein